MTLDFHDALRFRNLYYWTYFTRNTNTRRSGCGKKKYKKKQDATPTIACLQTPRVFSQTLTSSVCEKNRSLFDRLLQLLLAWNYKRLLARCAPCDDNNRDFYVPPSRSPDLFVYIPLIFRINETFIFCFLKKSIHLLIIFLSF